MLSFGAVYYIEQGGLRGGGWGGGSNLLSVIKFLRGDESFRSLVLIVNVE